MEIEPCSYDSCSCVSNTAKLVVTVAMDNLVR